jgi:hypothetical protein
MVPRGQMVAFVGRDLAQVESLRLAVMATPFLAGVASVSLTLPDLLLRLTEAPITVVALAADLVNGDQARLLWIQQQLEEAPGHPYLIQVPGHAAEVATPAIVHLVALVIRAALHHSAG